jgi:colanic acid/amylovoran biosynthesis glycosyltransferase
MERRLAIIFPNKSSTSETFIKAHVDHLPGVKKILYGGFFPRFSDGDVPLIKTPKKNIASKLLGKLSPQRDKGAEKQILQRNRIALENFLKENKINAVLAEYGPTGVAVMEVCQELSIPLIVHFHGFDAFHFETLQKHREGYIKLFDVANAIVVVSRDMERQLISMGASSDKVHYNVYGIDVDKFFPAPELNKLPVFLFTGRFINKKAPHLLIMAFAQVLKSVSNAHLIMIGDAGLGGSGELYMACRQLVKALKLEHAVTFKGALDSNSVAGEMRNAFAYVQHSVSAENGDSEGTPNTILEAGATGLPVISTRHGGIKDVVTDGENGFLVNEFDVDAMAQRMVDLSHHPEKAATMGHAARERAVNQFSLKQSIFNLSSIVDNAMAKK